MEVIPNALEKINKISGYTFKRNDLFDDVNKRYAGLIAQELEQVLPEAVYTNEKGYKSVAYGNVIALLIEGLKEANKIIEETNKKIQELYSLI